ncbi:MAG: DUF3467 domain-containing protein [Candidatus Falkowbacteria bacterium]
MSNEQPQEIKIADNIPGAEYTNAAYISHNSEEFQLVFTNIMAPSGRVVSKLITTPGHFKRMINAMNDNLQKYEAQFGKINEAEPVNDKEIGFRE